MAEKKKKRNNKRILYKMLQEEEGIEVGWLLYSIREMDVGALVDAIKVIARFSVGLNLKLSDIRIREKLNKSQKVQVLTVVIEAKYK